MTALGAAVHSGGHQRRIAPSARLACGAEETRTPDFLLAKEALYQLSYGPKSGYAGFGDASPCARALASGSGEDWAPRGEAALSVALWELTDAARANCRVLCASGRFWTRTRDLCLIRAVL